MVHIPTEVFAQAVSRRIERWVAEGRALDALRDEQNARWIMRFGRRWRIRATCNCAAFAGICAGALALELAGVPLGFWVRLGYAGFMFPVFLLSVWDVARAYSTRVVLDDESIAVESGLTSAKRFQWSQIVSARYSRFFGLVLESADGRRLRISTGMDGLRTLFECLIRLPPSAVHPTVPIEMLLLLQRPPTR